MRGDIKTWYDRLETRAKFSRWSYYLYYNILPDFIHEYYENKRSAEILAQAYSRKDADLLITRLILNIDRFSEEDIRKLTSLTGDMLGIKPLKITELPYCGDE
jgi:hypothetical protein